MLRMSILHKARLAQVSIAVGLALLILPSSTQAQECLPAFPGRDGDYIICPDDLNFDREYAALLKIDMTTNPPTETVLEWGSYYFPFDGYYLYAPRVTGIQYAIRATCNDITYTSDPADADLPSMSTISRGAECFPLGTRVITPRPMSPLFIEKNQYKGTLTIKVPGWAPSTSPTTAPAEFLYPKKGCAYRLTMLSYEGQKWGKAKILKFSGNPATMAVGDPTAIFNGQNIQVSGLNPYGKYYLFTEVLYDYGEKFGATRFRAISSYPLEVNLSSSVTGQIREIPKSWRR